MSNETVLLKRDCEATQIPSGEKLHLPRGTEVKITQTLGGSFTVVTENGWMARIAAEDADALGREVFHTATKAPEVSGEGKSIEDQVWGELRTCYDPEIPVNIVDLGLIYLCKVTPLPEGGNRVEIKMTLTAPGCGMGTVLQADAQAKILRIPGVKQADIQLVWNPPWDHTRMSEAAKLQLGFM